MTIKVFISPYANDGILRVIEAQYEHLPKFGVDIAKYPQEADVIINHGTALIEVGNVPQIHVGHGLYWSRQPWGDDFMEVNKEVVESMRRAVAHTAPSNWVNRAIRRGGFWYPKTIYHGIDRNKFVPKREHGNYVLWNKARADWVSDPRDVETLSIKMPSRQFISTVARSHTGNMKIIGAVPHAEMKKVVSEAGVYLATARETFGIGTLEALAYGIPVAGWDWGGQSEIIIQGETGYLAPPGDYKALAECIELCFAERERLSQMAVIDVGLRWGWEPRIKQYADLIKDVYDNYNRKDKPKVTVIVTAYNLDEYLPDCLNSIKRQTFQDFECIVIDDAQQESTKRIVENYAKNDRRFSYRPTPNNFGLTGSRNYGTSLAAGEYIRHVDADDFLADNALALEATALDDNRGIHIVYGHLEVVRTDGSQVIENNIPVRSGWPEEEFKWHYQMAHINQLPSCVMARKDVYVRSGGYRERMKRNEDAEFWCRVTSLGFRAKKFTQAVTYYHRERHNSKGANEWATEGPEPDWTSWFPWRWGGTNFDTGYKALRERGDVPKNTHLVPFGAQGNPPKPLRFWYVHDYAYPVVSIIVTVGPNHKRYLLDALDSIQAQTYPDWECIVVNDTGDQWGPDIMGAPWAKVVNMPKNKGVASARNEGVKNISPSSKYVVFLDADDYWFPWFLQKMVSYAEQHSGVIFSDLMMQPAEKEFKINTYHQYNLERIPFSMQYPGSSVLIPKNIVEAMIEYQGGYDEKIPGLEDWDYQFGVHHLGFCAYRIPEPLFVYRMYSTTNREKDFSNFDTIAEYMDLKYPDYRKGSKKIMCGCNNTKNQVPDIPNSLLSSSGIFQENNIHIEPGNPNQMVTMEYIGPREQTFSINSKVARMDGGEPVKYRFGNNDTSRLRAVFIGDVEYLLGLNEQGKQSFRVISAIEANANDPAAFIGQPITT